MHTTPITRKEFELFQRYLHQHIGLSLPESKQMMLSQRLGKRLRVNQCESYGAYFELIRQDRNAQELQILIDLITTHETYFFREPKHFDALYAMVPPTLTGRDKVRVWSAASSSGEEAYSAAMVLAGVLPPSQSWEILGTDISTQVLETARRGLYSLDQAERIPPAYLKKWCLKGKGRYDGTLLIDKNLRRHVSFRPFNLTGALHELGLFDVIFLRNVTIYFDPPTKRRVVEQVTEQLRPGGWLMMGHAEPLLDRYSGLEQITTAIYRKTHA
ncbi:CheR family methyltransferase [Amantichitinum ursilacus]|uniref:Chemotaxis protein methyltransferase n=1 Tax=Amantichitinum ursilacus TaxID=857265 RepID=A0A0N0XMU9_9NEIS|nr:CheR family methyltransferase [Amantichitinum ursilacus]KPC55105.1 Chemotaxis protein methyltransferase [Amantichitinum ursilacus]